MDITLATFVTAPAAALIGMRFDNAWAPSPSYAQSRNSVLTGQYPQREAKTRITDIFREAGYSVSEDIDSPPGTEDAPVFRLLEEPADPARLRDVAKHGVVAVCSLSGGPSPMSLAWPGVTDTAAPSCKELVSPMDLAPTLAAIAGLDVRPNAQLSFDGLNLVPVVRYGASGHAALFFDNGVRMQDAVLIDDVASPARHAARLRDEWETWHRFMRFGPLQ
ncbi:hypothetical protein ACL1GL_06465 [Corynebacterium striatum]